MVRKGEGEGSIKFASSSYIMRLRTDYETHFRSKHCDSNGNINCGIIVIYTP